LRGLALDGPGDPLATDGRNSSPMSGVETAVAAGKGAGSYYMSRIDIFCGGRT